MATRLSLIVLLFLVGRRIRWRPPFSLIDYLWSLLPPYFHHFLSFLFLLLFFMSFFAFLDAFSHLYKRVCASVRQSVRPSVHRSVRRLSVVCLSVGLSVRSSVPSYFQTTNMAITESEKWWTMVQWVTMKWSHLMHRCRYLFSLASMIKAHLRSPSFFSSVFFFLHLGFEVR